MIVVLPVCKPDFHLAVKWIKWVRLMAECADGITHPIIVWCARSLDESHINRMHGVIRGADNIEIRVNPEYYEHPELGYAAMANQMFVRALEMAEQAFPDSPVLWCEPDAIPTNPFWIQQIEEEYIWAKKPFMGDFHAPGLIPHMTGNAVYPPNWRELAPSIAALPGENPQQGWDTQCVKDTLPQSHHSFRIQQEWMAPKFTEKNIGLIHPETALFHRDKTSTLIDVLCARLHAPKIELEAPASPASPVQPRFSRPGVVGNSPNVEIMIVSCKRDADMLEYLLRSLKKNAQGFAGITVAVPVQDVRAFRHVPSGVTLTTFDENPGKGFLHHLIVKCRADELCPHADYIVHIDSDCLMWRRTTPEDFVLDGKCLMVREDYDLIAPRNPNRLIWRDCVEKATGLVPTFDYMVRHPQVYPRALYGALRAAVERHTGRGFDDYVFSCENGWPQGFAEFPALGTIGMHQFAHAFNVVDYDHEADSVECGAPGRGHQYIYRPERDALVEGWSHGGLARYKTDWDKFLAGNLPKFYVK